MHRFDTEINLNVLLIAENSAGAEAVQQLLVAKSDATDILQTIIGLSKGIEALLEGDYDVILLAPMADEDEQVQMARKLIAGAGKGALVVLTQSCSDKAALELAELGAHDYLRINHLDEDSFWRRLCFIATRSGKDRISVPSKQSFKAAKHHEDWEEILGKSGFGYFEVDLKGCLTRFNHVMPELLGHTEAELKGLNYQDFTDLENARKLMEAFNQVFLTGMSHHKIEFDVVPDGGDRRNLSCSCTIVRNEDREAVGFRGIVQDITRRKQAEEFLRENEDRYRTILDGADYGYFESDLEGNITFLNDALCRITGFPKAEIMGSRAIDYMDKENAEKTKVVYAQIYQTGVPNKEINYCRVRSDGRRIHIESSVSLIFDENGKKTGFRGIVKDVTQRKKAEEELRQSEDRYRTIIDSIEDAYYELDLKGKLTFFNNAMSKLHRFKGGSGGFNGYSDEKLKGLSYRDFIVEGDRARLKEAYRRVYLTGKPIRNIPYTSLTPKGSCHMESSVSLMRNSEGKPVGFRGITRDVSERRQVELQLQKAKDSAEAATRLKSEFLANMSHEIRTPMNGIIGMYNLLLDTDLDAEQADFVVTGKRSAEGLLTIINDILDFSKIEAGKLKLEIIDFDLRKSVQDVVDLAKVLADQNGARLGFQIHADIPSQVKGDPVRLKQILTNLTGNAVKFTPRGEVMIRLTPLKEEGENLTIRFEVIDDGIGIPVEKQSQLFSSFSQVDASTTRRYGGTGLGLAICKNLTELMGGKIGIISSPGDGSTFWFEIELEKQLHDTALQFMLAEDLSQKRFLVVDDHQANLDVMAGYLKSWGCSCDVARNSESALSVMRAVANVGSSYDMVITDHRMPDMDGADLGRCIKNDPSLKDTLLVLLTSQGNRGDAARMKSIGYSGYLTKPIRPSQLFDSLTMIFSHQALPGTAKDRKLVTRYSVSEARRKRTMILLAEDNIVNRKIALRLLEKFGVQADAVVNGQEALDALGSKKYDLVLMDVHMPEMGGLEAARAIRDPDSNVLNRNIPIIAMTAHAMKGDREKCLAAGMNDYVCKPIEPDLLFAAIERNISEDLL